MSSTSTRTGTYTVADVENVLRRLKADFLMMAESTGAWTRTQAADYGHDIELLAKENYLKHADVTLMSGTREICATRYDVNTSAGNLTSSRPGGVLWPKVASPHLRLLLQYASSYDAAAHVKMKPKLKIAWEPTDESSDHTGLTSSGSRDYASNSFGLQRKDWS